VKLALSLLIVMGLTVLAGAQVSAPAASMSFEVVERTNGIETLKDLRLYAAGIEVVAEAAVSNGNQFTLRAATLTVPTTVRRGARVKMTFRGDELRDLPPAPK
jgi:hypothetical protein